MPKYWEKHIFRHGSFPEVGQKQKTEREKRRRERLYDGNNNCQLRIATPPRVTHEKPPEPKLSSSSYKSKTDISVEQYKQVEHL